MTQKGDVVKMAAVVTKNELIKRKLMEDDRIYENKELNHSKTKKYKKRLRFKHGEEANFYISVLEVDDTQKSTAAQSAVHES